PRHGLDPRGRQWYRHKDKGQPSFITALEQDRDSVEEQHFDGNLEEFSLDEWAALDIDISDPPANWAGPQDGEDRGSDGNVTDMDDEAWEDPLQEAPADSPPRRS